MNLLTQNSKMKKSSKAGLTVVNWTIPAFQSSTGLKTCPNAGACAAGCYARSGTYRWSHVAKAHEEKLQLTQDDSFIQLMIKEIDSWLSKRHVDTLLVRIHDAGDFYSLEYWNRWRNIMIHFRENKKVQFYAYTKQVAMFKTVEVPSNFRLIFSFGGKQDQLIDVDKDFHSRVFESIEALEAAGYVDGTEDDMVAAVGASGKVGLVYHGAKNFENTLWSKAGSSHVEILALISLLSLIGLSILSLIATLF